MYFWCGINLENVVHMANWQPAPRFAVGTLVHALRLPHLDCVIVQAQQWCNSIHEWTYKLNGKYWVDFFHGHTTLYCCSKDAVQFLAQRRPNQMIMLL